MTKDHEWVSDKNITVSVLIDNCYLACAEISKIPYCDKWYFNRLSVPAPCRNKGIATKLMDRLVKILDDNKVILCCDINPYGDLNFDQLKQFYMKFGFVEDEKYNLIRNIGGTL